MARMRAEMPVAARCGEWKRPSKSLAPRMPSQVRRTRMPFPAARGVSGSALRLPAAPRVAKRSVCTRLGVGRAQYDEAGVLGRRDEQTPPVRLLPG